MRTCASYFAIILFFPFLKSSAQNCTVNAGIPQTICANGTLTLQGQTNGSFSGGTANSVWSQVSGSLTTITAPSNTTTTVTGFTAGTYVYKISATCLDGSNISDNVSITVRPVVIANAGLDATYCPGTYALAANSPSPGTGNWSIITTNNGVTVSTNNSPTSNIVLNPLNSGNTSLRWTTSQSTSGTTCTSFDDVIITNIGSVATVNAGSDITLNNCYTTTHSTPLSASFAGTSINGQQGIWSQISGPNTASFSSTSTSNATVSNLIQGTYTFRWTVSGPCVNGSDEVQVIVPASNSSLTSIASISSQSFCDGRTSTVLVATQPAFAGETALWTVVSGSGTFSNSATYSTTVTNIGSGSNTYRYTITNAAGCSAFRDVIVNNVEPPTLTITTPSPILLNCSTSNTTITTVNYTASGGTGITQYRIIAAPSGYTLPTFASSANTATSFNLNGLNIPGTYVVRVIRNGTSDCNAAAQDINVIASQTPTVSNAGTDQLLACNVASTALAGNVPSIGSGSWSQINGPNTALIANTSQYNTTISGLVPGAYDFKWIINGGNSCIPSEDIVTVRVVDTAPTTANAGTDRNNICHTGPIKLDGNTAILNEVGTWTVSPSTGVVFSNVNDSKATVTGMGANTIYTFTWTIVNGCGSSSDDVVISTSGTQGAGQANAGADRCLAASTTSITMAATAASPAGTTGTWSLISGPNTPTITNINSPTTTVNNLTQGTYVFVWSLNVTGCNAVEDTVVTTISPTLTTANAGSAQTICATNVTLTANTPTVGTGTWSQVSGPGGATIVNAALNNTAVNGLTTGLYRFRWTISNGVCSNNSDVLVTVSPLPSTAIIAADSTCLTRTTLNALAGNTPTSGIGTWTQLSGPNVAAITNMSSPTSGLSGLINGNYVFRWTINGGTGCTASMADMNVSVNMPTAAINNLNVCNVTAATLTGTANIVGTWSQTSGPSTSAIQAVQPNIGTLTNLQLGTYTFQFTPTPVSGCPSLTARTMTLNNSSPVTTSNAGSNQSLCNVTSFSLSANTPTTGTGVWSRVSGPNSPSISSTSSTTPTVTGATTGLYTYRWTITNGGCTSADDITVSISVPATTSNAGSNQTFCSSTTAASLNANVAAVGTGLWSQVSGPATATFSNASSNTSSVNGLTAPGSYAFRWTITNGACVSNSQTTIQVDELPNANAGSNVTITTTTYTLQATPPTVGTGVWSQIAGPASTITDVNAYNTSITGLQIGNTYTYRWTVTNGSACAAATSDVSINVSASLPITLLSFIGDIQRGYSNLVWEVTRASNPNHFEIERSTNGINFSAAGIVTAGASNRYAYQELFPTSVTTCYYRLKMIDTERQSTYSPIIRLNAVGLSSKIAVVPNPIKEDMVVRVEHTHKEAGMFLIINGMGQKIHQQALTLQAGSQIFMLPRSLQLPAGSYQIIVTTASGMQLKTIAFVAK